MSVIFFSLKRKGILLPPLNRNIATAGIGPVMSADREEAVIGQKAPDDRREPKLVIKRSTDTSQIFN